jgi:hypothetical protein
MVDDAPCPVTRKVKSLVFVGVENPCNYCQHWSAIQLTQLIAVVAGEIFENPTLADRSEPAGTGVGGVMSATLPYG